MGRRCDEQGSLTNEIVDANYDDNSREIPSSGDLPDDKFLYSSTIAYTKSSDLLEFVRNGAPFERDTLPFVISEPCRGTYTFVVKPATYRSLRDVAFDDYRPWSSSAKGVQKVIPKSTTLDVDGIVLRIVKGRHPRVPSFKRQISYAEGMDSFVVVEYIFETNGITPPKSEGRQFEKPSVICDAKSALRYRGTRGAARVLKDQNIEINPKTLSYLAPLSEAVLKNTGPVRTTNASNLLQACKDDKSMSVTCWTEGGKQMLRALKCFPDAIRVISKCLPNTQELQRYRTTMTRRMDCGSPVVPQYNNSRYVDRIGETVYYDTTFDLCDVYMSVVEAQSKNVHLIIGYMLHTTKSSSNHSAFGLHLSKWIEKICDDNVRVPNLVTDGEVGLKELIQNESPHFADTIVGHCDVHLRSNVLEAFPKSKHGEKFCTYLFGKVECQEDGTEIVRPGLLSATSEEDFHENLSRLQTKAPQFHGWVLNRKKKLFDFHSRRTKVLSGCNARFRFTNVAECKNNNIKTIIANRRLPAEEIVKRMNDIHREEMTPLVQSCFGEGKFVIIKDDFETLERNKVTKEDYARLLKNLGIAVPYVSRPESIPNWYFEGKTEEEVYEECCTLSSMKCQHLFDSDQRFVIGLNQENSAVVTVTRKGHSLVCSSKQCRRGCLHEVRVLMEVGTKEMFDELKIVREKTKFRSTVSDGSKGSRKGGIMSKHNYIRKHAYSVRSALDSSISTLEDSCMSTPNITTDGNSQEPLTPPSQISRKRRSTLDFFLLPSTSKQV